MTDNGYDLRDYERGPIQQEDPYTDHDAYTDWVGEQPDDADTSEEAWDEYKYMQISDEACAEWERTQP